MYIIKQWTYISICISHPPWSTYGIFLMPPTTSARSSDSSSAPPLCWSSPRPMGERRCLWRVNVGSTAATGDTPRHVPRTPQPQQKNKEENHKMHSTSGFFRCLLMISCLLSNHQLADVWEIQIWKWYNRALLNGCIVGWYSVPFSWGMWKQHGQGAQWMIEWLRANTFVFLTHKACACANVFTNLLILEQQYFECKMPAWHSRIDLSCPFPPKAIFAFGG